MWDSLNQWLAEVEFMSKISRGKKKKKKKNWQIRR